MMSFPRYHLKFSGNEPDTWWEWAYTYIDSDLWHREGPRNLESTNLGEMEANLCREHKKHMRLANFEALPGESCIP